MIDYFPKDIDVQQNFGDYLAEILKRLFVDNLEASPDIHYLVGSYICDYYVERARTLKKSPDAQIHFWGCGWRGEPFKYQNDPDIHIHGIRGPLSRDGLGLPADTPLGDPAFLLPLLIPKPAYNTGKILLVPHFYEPDLMGIMNDRATIGYDDMMLPHVFDGIRQLELLVREIATAGFVMAGAMHAAIVAQAYGVPFCYFRKEHLDVPFKWEDISASMGIKSRHVYTAMEGIEFYKEVQSDLRIPDVAKLLAAAPGAIKPQYLSAVGL